MKRKWNKALHLLLILAMVVSMFPAMGITASAASVSTAKVYVVDKGGTPQLYDTWAYDSTNETYTSTNPSLSSIITTGNLVYSGQDNFSSSSRILVAQKYIKLSDLVGYAGLSLTDGLSVACGCFADTPTSVTNTISGSTLKTPRYYYPSYVTSQTLTTGAVWQTPVQVPYALVLKGYAVRNNTDSAKGLNTASTGINPATDESSLATVVSYLNGISDTANSLRYIFGQTAAEATSNTATFGSSTYNVAMIKITPEYNTINVVTDGAVTVSMDDGYFKAAAGESVSFTLSGYDSGKRGVVTVKDSDNNSVSVTRTGSTYTFTMPEGDASINISVVNGSMWSGSADTAWYTSDPTASSYTIDTAEELAGLASIVNGTGVVNGTSTSISQNDFSNVAFNLTTNITLDEDGKYTSATGTFGQASFPMTTKYYKVAADASIWTPIGSGVATANSVFTSRNYFRGTFNGNSHTISGLYTSGTSTVQGLFGCVGNGGTVKDLTVSGCVAAKFVAGGIAAYLNGGTISGCVNNAIVYADSGEVAGSGLENGTSKTGALGGIVGNVTGTSATPSAISKCRNNGAVVCTNTSKGGRTGGIVGLIDNAADVVTVERCLNTGDVTTYQYGGGIVGMNFSSASPVKECANQGTIMVSSSGTAYCGGIAGLCNSSITNCYNTATVGSLVSTSNIGGIVGNVASYVTNCYSTGMISNARGTYGNISGAKTSNPINCYYLDTNAVSGATDSSGTTAKTASQLKAAGMLNYLGTAYEADTASPKLNNGYPVLAWQNGNEPTASSNQAVTVGTIYPAGSATVTSTVTGAAFGDTVTINVSGITSGKRVQSVNVGDIYGDDYPVTTTSPNAIYTFQMPACPVSVNVVTENIPTSTTTHLINLPTDLDPIWTVSSSSTGTSSGTAYEGATVTLTVARAAEAYMSSLNGVSVEDTSGNAISVSTKSTASGAYDTIGTGVYTFTMPASDVTVDVHPNYSVLNVYVVSDGVTSSAITYTREQMLALAKNNIYYTGYDSYPAAVIGKATTAVTISDLFDDVQKRTGSSNADLVAGGSVYVKCVDGWDQQYTYNFLYGTPRYYYPNIASPSAIGKTVMDPMLVIKGYQSRISDLPAGQTIDDQTADTLNTYRFVYGLTDAQYNDGVPESANKTVGYFGKYVNTLILNLPATTKTNGGGGDGSSTTPITTGKSSVDTAATVNNGTATASVSKSSVTSAIAAAEKNIQINVTNTTGASNVSVTIPTASFNEVKSSTANTLTVSSAVADITFDKNTISGIAADAAGSDLSINAKTIDSTSLDAAQKAAVGNDTVYEFSISSGNSKISSFDGSVAVSVPYSLKAGESADGVSVWYLDSTGKLTSMPCTYDAASGKATFKTNHFSYYVIGYSADAAAISSMTDISAGNWYYDAAKYAISNGLFKGTSSTTFSPGNMMTRGMFVTVLGRMNGVDVSAYTKSAFSDVSAKSYYSAYVAWAAENGIVGGIGSGKFAPDQAITREQMAAIMLSYAKKFGTDTTATADLVYTDKASVNDWAVSGVQYCAATGLISGYSNGSFQPQKTATRAEVASVLMRFAEKF